MNKTRRATIRIAQITLAAVVIACGNNYPRPHEPPVPSAFIPLPPGKVTPSGWLREWAILARANLINQLDTYHDPFNKHVWERTSSETAWEPFEQCAYWTDGLLRFGYILGDTVLIDKALKGITIQTGLNAPDYSPAKTDTSWPFAAFARALLARYAATGEAKVLASLKSAYAAAASRLRGGPWGRSMENVESMLETFSWGGDSTILKTALQGYASVAWTPVNHWYHGVTWNEMSKIPAIASQWMTTGSADALKISTSGYQWLDTTNVLPCGVNSSGEPLWGIDGAALLETCDVADFIWSNVWLKRVTGMTFYGDRIERAFYNAGAGCVDSLCSRLVYFQQCNRVNFTGTGLAYPASFQRTQYPCCPGNLTRIIPNFVMHMWMATRDNGLAAILYGPCKVSALVADSVPVTISCETSYPFDERISLVVEPASPAAFPLYLRIPAWCSNTGIAVNGSRIGVTQNANGYAVVSRQWRQGDRVEITFPMTIKAEVRRTSNPGQDNDNGGSLVTDAKFGPPFVSVTRGPLLFSLSIPGTDPNTSLPSARYQYALAVTKEGGLVNATCAQKMVGSPFRWQVSSSPLGIQCDAVPITWSDPFWPSVAGESRFVSSTKPAWIFNIPRASGTYPVRNAERITLVPYACSPLRMSMFALTETAGPSKVIRGRPARSAKISRNSRGFVLPGEWSNARQIHVYSLSGRMIATIRPDGGRRVYLPKGVLNSKVYFVRTNGSAR